MKIRGHFITEIKPEQPFYLTEKSIVFPFEKYK